MSWLGFPSPLLFLGFKVIMPSALFLLLLNRIALRQSSNRVSRLPEDPTYLSASEFVRSILDDRPANANVSPSGELYRAIERFHRNVDRVRRDITALQATDAVMSSGADRDLRRRFNRDPQTSSTTLPGISSLSSSGALPPLRSLGSRRGSGTSGGRLGRHPASRFSSSTVDMEESVRSLEDANTSLRALLDFTTAHPIPHLSTPPSTGPFYSQDQPEENRRVKRRKLDSDKLAGPSFKGFRYGRFGQVEAGQLKMEIVSCDGGLYSNQPSYAAENILRNDTSVYCTKGNRCNIVLRHQGSTVFSLQELIIKAPGSDFSSPVREGMVFVSMRQDDLLTRTAQYQIQYLPTRGSSRCSPHAYTIRHDEGGAASTRLAPPRRRHQLEEEEDDPRMAQIPSEFNVSPPPFTITTVCSTDDDGPRAGHNNEWHDDFIWGGRGAARPPNRIGALPFESDNSDDDANAWGSSAGGSFWTSSQALPEGWQSVRARGGEHNARAMSLAEVQEASQIATQEAVRAVGGELMTPLVHFSIEKDKNRCAIRFDPPVSGRYVLLKMWNPHHDPSANIDIQGVIAKGFAGPRLFPSLDLR